MSSIKELFDNFEKYSEINKSIMDNIKDINKKILHLEKYEDIYDLGLSKTNMNYKTTILNQLLNYRTLMLKTTLIKLYTDVFKVHDELQKLFEKISIVLKKEKYSKELPPVPKIIISEKDNSLQITEFKEWMLQLSTFFDRIKGKINLLNVKRETFQEIICNELPTLDIKKTMDLQRKDLINEYQRIKHKYICIINFMKYIISNIFEYSVYEWTIPDKKLINTETSLNDDNEFENNVFPKINNNESKLEDSFQLIITNQNIDKSVDDKPLDDTPIDDKPLDDTPVDDKSVD